MVGVFKLLLLFIAVPLIEMALLVVIGQYIGFLPTLGIVFLTGFLGALLARSQGLQVVARIRSELGFGRVPAESLIEGLLILVAAAVLLTPGLITDLFGFLCLIPATRRPIRQALWSRLKSQVESSKMDVMRPRSATEVIDIELGNPKS